MAISMSVHCPDCKNLHTVYIEDDSIPSMDDWYTYTCPQGHKNIAFPAGVATLDQKIPPNGIIATPADPTT